MLTQYVNQENNTPAFVIHNALDAKNCDKIIAEYKKLLEPAVHDDGKGGLTNDKKTRSSNVAWINNSQINSIMKDLMHIANHSAGWCFDITGHELYQFTQYNSKDHYSWHQDGTGCTLSKRYFTFGKPNNLLEVAVPGCVGTVRKISASVLLNDDFSGGEFDFATLKEGKIQKTEVKPKRGDAIFFPSHLQHRVRPVKTGTRYSLVCWFAGPPFK